MSRVFCRRASLVLNAVLAVTVAVLILHELNGASTPSPIQVSPGKMVGEVSPGKTTRDLSMDTEPLDLPRYADIKSASDRRRAIIDQLRAIGVPNDILARVAQVDFEEQWDSRFEECHGDMDKLAAV